MSDLSDNYKRCGAIITPEHLQQQQNEVHLLFSIYTDKEVVDLRPSNTKKVAILAYSVVFTTSNEVILWCVTQSNLYFHNYRNTARPIFYSIWLQSKVLLVTEISMRQ